MTKITKTWQFESDAAFDEFREDTRRLIRQGWFIVTSFAAMTVLSNAIATVMFVNGEHLGATAAWLVIAPIAWMAADIIHGNGKMTGSGILGPVDRVKSPALVGEVYVDEEGNERVFFKPCATCPEECAGHVAGPDSRTALGLDLDEPDRE